MICEKCQKKDFPEWESRVTYEGLDIHHNPPEEIDRFLKKEWSGEFFKLCRKCHKELHKEITEILKKYSNQPKYNSDYWLMLNSNLEQINKAKEEIYFFTKKWISIKEDDGNSK